MHRAYSLINWKSVDEEKRLIEGIATSPEVDRMGDVVETEGIEYKLPLPLLWQHRADQPIGKVLSARKTKDGIFVKAQVAAAGVAEFIDNAWRLIKAQLAPGFSIGFRPLEEAFNKETGGYRFIRSEWMELSVVTIPANAEATILTVKAAAESTRAVSGNRRSYPLTSTDQPITLPAVAGIPKGKPMTLSQQIANAEAKLTANEKRLDDIAASIAEGTQTRSQEQVDECKSLEQENTQLAEDIAFMKGREKAMLARAAAVTPAPAATDPQQHAQKISRGEPVQVKSMAPKGILPARMAIAMYKGGNVGALAAQEATRLWPDNPEVAMVIRAAVEAGDTTTSGWASQLVPAAQQMMNEFLELLRPATILGRVPGVRNNMPFNIAIPIETASGTVNWVGEGAGKPVGALTFTSATLRWAKAAGIVVITEELARFSQPSADMIIRDSMIKTLGRFFDTQFVGTAAEVSNVSPAGILNGISATSTSGTTPAAFRTDLATLIGKFITNSVDPSGIVLLMSATQALRLGLMTSDLGVKLFPDINVRGGSVEGFPVVVSENVGTKIIALNASEILIAEDPGVRVDVSREATVEMESTPAVGESSPITTLGPLKSLWQNNLVGFRVERYMTWKAGRTSAVEYLNNVAYVPS